MGSGAAKYKAGAEPQGQESGGAGGVKGATKPPPIAAEAAKAAYLEQQQKKEQQQQVVRSQSSGAGRSNSKEKVQYSSEGGRSSSKQSAGGGERQDKNVPSSLSLPEIPPDNPGSGRVQRPRANSKEGKLPDVGAEGRGGSKERRGSRTLTVPVLPSSEDGQMEPPPLDNPMSVGKTASMKSDNAGNTIVRRRRSSSSGQPPKSKTIDVPAASQEELLQGFEVGDRVLGEGQAGREMGVGTVVGVGKFAGSLLVRYDESGNSHSIKAKSLVKVSANEEKATSKEKADQKSRAISRRVTVQ